MERSIQRSDVDLEVAEDGIARITFDRSEDRVNLLTADVMRTLERMLEEVRVRTGVRAVLFRSGKPRMFVAGADVEEIASYSDTVKAAEAARAGQAVFQRIAELEIPSACAIGGTCMGGGTELALACDYRVAADDPAVRIGLPEIRIGIIPGFGGTQRLPRLVGLRLALDLIVSGRALTARQAYDAGLVDLVVPRELLDREATALLAREIDEPRRNREILRRRSRPVSQLLAKIEPLRRIVLSRVRRRTAEKVRPEAYPAPFRAIDAVDAAYRLPLPQGLDVEGRIFGEMIPTRTSKNLIWLFKSQTAARKDDPAVQAVPRTVRRVGILGAGVMGGGIGQLIADRDIPVRLKDVRYDALLTALRTARGIWERRVNRGRMSDRELERKIGFISPTIDDTGFARTDLVIEAMVEDVDVKRRVLAEVERAFGARGLKGDRLVFASNTSSIPIDEIAEGATWPERVVGLHFFNPVHRMPLVEIVVGARTAPEAVATVRDFAIRLGKTPILVRDRPGFLVNRVLMFYLAEAVRMLEEGVRIDAVDGAMTAFGMPLGPFALMDQIGLDTAVQVAGVLQRAFGDRAAGSAAVLEAMVAAERFGAKNGHGFYRYRGGERTVPDSEVYRLAEVRASRGLPPETIQERLLLAMINEATICLEEGVVRTPTDVDLAIVLGAGFPPYRGGLLRHTDEIGIAVTADRLTRLAEAHGPRFKPPALLRQMIREERRFYGWSGSGRSTSGPVR